MKKKKKKTLYLSITSFLLKSLYSVFFIFSLLTFYFLVFISVKPQSFPFVTTKVENYINNNLPYGDRIKIDKISIELEDFYKLNINLAKVNLDLDKKNLFLPKISAQFSLINLAINQRPSKIKFEDAKIEIDQALSISDNLNETTEDNNKEEYIKKIWDIFILFNNNKIITKKFEIDNIDLLFRDKTKNTLRSIKIKHSNIEIDNNKEDLEIFTKNVFNLDNKVDVELNANCQFNQNSYLRCDVGFFNLIPQSFSKTIKGIEFLSKIDTRLSGNANFEINNNYQIRSILFNANSNKGSFDYKQFFDDKINFENLYITGEVSNSLKNIKISELKVNFDQDVNFLMSLDIENFQDPDLENILMYFKVSNSPGEKITKFWPIFLGPKIRNWVGNNIDQGLIKAAYANIILKRQNGIKFIDKIDSEILFSKLRLKYNDNAPEIINIDGIASFTKDNMKIDIVSADVLESKIKMGKVTIADFGADKIRLNINGLVSGKGYDPLKYINHKSEFAQKAENYINGYSDSTFNISFPIIDNLELKDSYIKILSNIKNVNSDIFKDNSAINISVIKPSQSDEFSTNIDFSNAKINLNEANIFKDKNIDSTATLKIKIKNNILNINNVNLVIDNSKNYADIKFNLDPFELSYITIQNNYNNKYNLYYEANKDKSLRKLNINGQYLNLEPIINNSKNISSQTQETGRIYDNISIVTNLAEIKLANNQTLNNVNININCLKSICIDSHIKSVINNNHKFIDIELFQKSKKHDYTTIKGRISDISSIARGLNISNQIMNGNTQIKGEIFIANNKISLLKGNLNIDDGFSIIKNEIFNQIISDKNFEKLVTKIDKSDKINFDKLNLDFRFENNNIKIEELIASSYLMGFTSKGDINLANNETKLKGLIVPGYSLNKLFGIGNIPVLGPIIVGEKGGGLFAIRYQYNKNKDQKEGNLKINPASAIAPGPIRNIFGLFD